MHQLEMQGIHLLAGGAGGPQFNFNTGGPGGFRSSTFSNADAFNIFSQMGGFGMEMIMDLHIVQVVPEVIHLVELDSVVECQEGLVAEEHDKDQNQMLFPCLTS